MDNFRVFRGSCHTSFRLDLWLCNVGGCIHIYNNSRSKITEHLLILNILIIDVNNKIRNKIFKECSSKNVSNGETLQTTTIVTKISKDSFLCNTV